MKTMCAYFYYWVGCFAFWLTRFFSSERLAQFYQDAMMRSVQLDTNDKIWKSSWLTLTRRPHDSG